MPTHYAKGSIWDRIAEGSERLLGLPRRGLLDPQVQEQGRQRGLLSLGSSLLQSSVSTDPTRVAFGPALGRAVEAGIGGAEAGVAAGQGQAALAAQQDVQAARQQVFARYRDHMTDPAALAQASNELAALGDMEGAELLAGMVETFSGEGARPALREGVDPATGAPALFRVPMAGPAEVVEGITPTPPREGDAANQLLGRFIQQTQPFAQIAQSYGRILVAGTHPSAAGDLALIFNFMKMLDPGSVVRESEFANAANAAGVPDRIRALYNRVLNGERLADPQRRDFLDRAKRLADRSESDLKRFIEVYKGRAERAGVNPDDVVQNYFAPGAATAPSGPLLLDDARRRATQIFDETMGTRR